MKTMKTSSVAGAMLMLFLAGCVSTAELPERVTIQAPLPQDTRSVTIRTLPMPPGAITNVEGVDDAPRRLAGSVKEALALKRPDWQIRVAEELGAKVDGDVTVTLQLLQIDGGSAALRFWIGLNTGGTQSVVEVSVVDKTGKGLASTKISERTVCPIGACTDSNDEMVRKNLQVLGTDVAAFVLDPVQFEKDKQSRSQGVE